MRHGRREQVYGSQGRKGNGRMDWEIDIYTLLILCIKQITDENWLCSTGNSTQGSEVTQMGRKSKEERICVCTWLIHIAVRQKLTHYCKATILKLQQQQPASFVSSVDWR